MFIGTITVEKTNGINCRAISIFEKVSLIDGLVRKSSIELVTLASSTLLCRYTICKQDNGQVGFGPLPVSFTGTCKEITDGTRYTKCRLSIVSEAHIIDRRFEIIDTRTHINPTIGRQNMRGIIKCYNSDTVACKASMGGGGYISIILINIVNELISSIL